MSVLRKKIDKVSDAAPLDQNSVAQCWKSQQEEILAIFEGLIEPLYWKVTEVDVKPVVAKDLPKIFAKTGLYATWGPTERETHCMVLLDTKLAAIISKFGFEGEITELKKLEKHPISKFDILLMEEVLAHSKDFFDPPSTIERRDYIEFSDIPLAPEFDKWMKLDLNYSVSLGLKSEDLALSVSLLMTEAQFNAHLKKGPKVEPSTETIDFDVNAETLTRHIDKSVTSLRAVLESCEMTVADCTRLQIGQVIPLPGVSLQELRVEAQLKDTRVCIARAALGIHKTRRAVQLVEDVSAEFIDQGRFAEL